MKRFFVIAWVCVCFAIAIFPVSIAALEVDDERASAFVAGAAEPGESFRPTEGLVLLILAGLAVLACFSLIMYSGTTHGRCKTDLDAIHALLGREDRSHA